jgi:hypothetical protein
VTTGHGEFSKDPPRTLWLTEAEPDRLMQLLPSSGSATPMAGSGQPRPIQDRRGVHPETVMDPCGIAIHRGLSTGVDRSR